jgi:hypothetical protein
MNFYVFYEADFVDGSIHEETLCKFGMTRNDPDRRRRQHELTFKRRFDAAIDLEMGFLASGVAAFILEDHVRHQTRHWNPDFFDPRKSEWRVCSVSQLIQVVHKGIERTGPNFEVLCDVSNNRFEK